MKELPIIGKTYNCYDDGKIRESRKYEVTITKIIPFSEANGETIKLWKEEGLTNYWLFKETDYLIEFNSTESEDAPKGVFARTKAGYWFGLGNWWNSGQLDVDGSLTKWLQDNS